MVNSCGRSPDRATDGHGRETGPELPPNIEEIQDFLTLNSVVIFLCAFASLRFFLIFFQEIHKLTFGVSRLTFPRFPERRAVILETPGQDRFSQLLDERQHRVEVVDAEQRRG